MACQIWPVQVSSRAPESYEAGRALSRQLGLKVALVRLLVHLLQADDIRIVLQQLLEREGASSPGLHEPAGCPDSARDSAC